jgi:hypothetical protein
MTLPSNAKDFAINRVARARPQCGQPLMLPLTVLKKVINPGSTGLIL